MWGVLAAVEGVCVTLPGAGIEARLEVGVAERGVGLTTLGRTACMSTENSCSGAEFQNVPVSVWTTTAIPTIARMMFI